MRWVRANPLAALLSVELAALVVVGVATARRDLTVTLGEFSTVALLGAAAIVAAWYAEATWHMASEMKMAREREYYHRVELELRRVGVRTPVDTRFPAPDSKDLDIITGIADGLLAFVVRNRGRVPIVALRLAVDCELEGRLWQCEHEWHTECLPRQEHTVALLDLRFWASGTVRVTNASYQTEWGMWFDVEQPPSYRWDHFAAEPAPRLG